MKYAVEIAGRTVHVEVDEFGVRVNGRQVEGHLDGAGTSPVRRIVRGERSREFVATPGEGKGRWRLAMEAEHFDVEALDERTLAIRAMAGQGAPPPVAGALLAPMPGLVVRVLVAEGDRVAAGAALVVVEAMKMENELKALAPGMVRRVRVEPGTGVEKGAVLVELDPSG
ncbi:MAG: biotin/lipoyl-binding protein [Gemmatimonadetes bacterium]|nr:biotin/lipoyl-binding protein [Gemmatimonadota bacterium]